MRKRIAADLIAFGLAAVLFLFLCAVLRITPFGDNTFLFYDMKRQYVSFFSYYKSLFFTENDLRYSLSLGLGTEMPGFFAYYLTSPLNLMFLVVPEAYFTEAVTVLLCVKTGLCAASCCEFLGYYGQHRGNPLSGYTVILSVAYAFCGHFVMNWTNTIWTDACIWTPVFFMASLKLLEGGEAQHSERRRRNFDYIFCTLAAAVLVLLQYYIAYMVLLFAFVWMLLHTVLYRLPWKRFFLWCASVLHGAILSAFLILPAGLALKDTSKAEGSVWSRLIRSISRIGSGAYSPIETVRRLLPLQFKSDQIYEGAPQIYCGVLVLAGAVLYLVNAFRRQGQHGQEQKKNALEALLLLLFLALCFLLPPLDIVFHAGTAPQGYRFRYAFLFVLVLVICAHRYLDHLTDKKGANGILMFLFAVIVLGDLLFNAAHTVYTLSYNAENASDFRAWNASVTTALDEAGIVNGQETGSDEVFRMELKKSRRRSENDALFLGFNGVTQYATTQNQEENLFLQSLGLNFDDLISEYDAEHLPESIRAFLGVRYQIEDDGLIAYEALPMAFCQAQDKDLSFDNPFDRMNAFYGAEVFRKIAPGTGVDDAVYFYLSGIGDKTQNLSVHVDGTFFCGYGNAASLKVLRLPSADVTLTADTDDADYGTMHLVTEDVTLLRERIAEFKERAAVLHKVTSSLFRVVVPAGHCVDGDFVTVFLPYHRNWKASVNGVNCEVGKTAGAYMKVMIPEGTAVAEGFDIALKYVPAGMVAGKVLSVAAMVVLVMVLLGQHRGRET